MSYTEALHHHVLRSLERDLGRPPFEADDDGDYACGVDGQIVWVRPLLDREPPMVRAWSPAVHGVKKTAALLTEINDVNLGLNQARIFLVGGKTVMVSAEVELESVDPGELGRLVTVVGETAASVGELITAVFGGERPFAAMSEAVHDDEPHWNVDGRD